MSAFHRELDILSEQNIENRELIHCSTVLENK